MEEVVFYDLYCGQPPGGGGGQLYCENTFFGAWKDGFSLCTKSDSLIM